ncbi:5'-nucleotidase [Thermomonospora echinospora]|uniref:5'-nucleotidase n=1 Tax=Thermomonospora echinospora TaxID=1992 RepID=A0A1H5ZY25_9ACTN|nr:5'-nucleotidase C-terminal domain-containing protein [Thermomonospora echinospora]SEG41042.1 5'-nucleotidase [Thermomonospora echinospora]
MTQHPRPRRLAAVTAIAALAVAGPLATPGSAAPAAGHGGPAFTLTILHNNDGESKLLSAPGQPDYGGVARFATLVGKLRAQATTGRPGRGQAARRGAITLSSGDNFLAGPEFSASLRKGVPFYDALALKAVGYDAMAIGNHEFDFGPDILADFIGSFGAAPPPFVSANLDMSDEARLNALVKKGTIVSSVTVRERGERIGVVGATTPALAALSSPRRVKVLQDVAGLVQAQVDRLSRRGVDKIVLISHLQGLTEDRALVPMLRNVDVVIAGGGDELMASDTTPLVPGDVITTDPATGERLRYPMYARDRAGVDVPVVTTAGDYKYVGRLVVNFDRRGKVVGVDRGSGPVRVSGVAPDAVAPDRRVQRTVVEPVSQFVDDMAANVLGESAVPLEGRRDPGVRTKETNLGNLMADSLLAAGRKNAAAYGVTPPQVALQNGGGIRNNSLIPAGPVTELNTFQIAAFSNFVSVVPDVPRAQFKEILENAVSRMPVADGRFAQVAGFRFTYDPAGTAQVVDDAGTVLTPGTRVRSVTLDDGTVIVANGQVVPGAGLSVATNDFSARGGDQWPFRGLPFTTVGLTYQQALADYITGDLGGRITAAAYPEAGSGRITTP